MKLPPEAWHKRYVEQARWTQPARAYLFGKTAPLRGKKIMDVGCGTGAILQELSLKSQPHLFGVDISSENLALAKQYSPRAELQQGDAHHLPFASGSFDLVYTHFVLLWLTEPLAAMREMCRVTRPGGFVIALAEPDYGGRVDYPPELSVIGDWQIESLKYQGADPFIGRRLGELLLAAGLVNVHSGVMGGEWNHANENEVDTSEWEIVQNDLEILPQPPPYWEINRLKTMDAQAQQAGSRVLYVPTFYAYGQAP